MSEKMAEPKNIPHNWDYQPEFHTVTCAGCSFRYGAEHPDSDGWWTCPNCGNGNNPTRASSPAQEPVTTEPVAWRWKVYGIWHYAGGFPVSGAEPLYAIPAPPQPGREWPEGDRVGIDPDLARALAIEECAQAITSLRQSGAVIFDAKHSGQRGEDRSTALYDAINIVRALTGEPK